MYLKSALRVTIGLMIGMTIACSQAAAADLSGFRITAVTDKPTYQPGQAVTVYVTAENKLDQPVRIIGEFSQFDRFGLDEVWAWSGPNNGKKVGNIGPFSDFSSGVLYYYPLYSVIQVSPSEAPRPVFTIPPHNSVIFARAVFDKVYPGSLAQNLDPGEYLVHLVLSRVATADNQLSATNYTVDVPLRVVPDLSKMETPWRSNEQGTESLEMNWNYRMGYQFTPQVNGIITKLAGKFHGSKVVWLWDAQGSAIAVPTIVGDNTWREVDIAPVRVYAGQTYTVAVQLDGSGGSFRTMTTLLPQTYKNIRILQSVYGDLTHIPTTGSTRYMYGQVDVTFIPD